MYNVLSMASTSTKIKSGNNIDPSTEITTTVPHSRWNNIDSTRYNTPNNMGTPIVREQIVK